MIEPEINKENNEADEKQSIKKEKPVNSDIIINTVEPINTRLKHVEWSPENEMIMVEWCDIAQCYKWLNSRSHNYYSYMHAWFTIPAITISTISGTASFAQASLPVEYQLYAPMFIGTLNIFIGILTTIQQYLKISELNEAHRVSAISWDKFARNIRIELSKSPNERMDAGQFIKISRQEFDRLMETSPSVNERIIKAFETAFKGKPDSIERKRFEELKKPDICNIIISSNEYRHPWYLEDEEALTQETNQRIKEKDQEIQEKETIIKLKELEEETSKKIHNELKLIDAYISKFFTLYDREPMIDEIQRHGDELVESKKIDRESLNKYLDKRNTNNITIELV